MKRVVQLLQPNCRERKLPQKWSEQVSGFLLLRGICSVVGFSYCQKKLPSVMLASILTKLTTVCGLESLNQTHITATAVDGLGQSYHFFKAQFSVFKTLSKIMTFVLTFSRLHKQKNRRIHLSQHVFTQALDFGSKRGE